MRRNSKAIADGMTQLLVVTTAPATTVASDARLIEHLYHMPTYLSSSQKFEGWE